MNTNMIMMMENTSRTVITNLPIVMHLGAFFVTILLFILYHLLERIKDDNIWIYFVMAFIPGINFFSVLFLLLWFKDYVKYSD